MQNSKTSSNDSYSHTASSTAGYTQNRTYPVLPDLRAQLNRSIIEKVEASATNFMSNVVGPDAAVSMTNKLKSVVTSGPSAREVLHNGAMVQLISKNVGRPLQIVMTADGALTFDSNGVPDGFNTYFMVEEGEKGRLRFHNNCNYLAFDGKHPCIQTLPPGPKNNIHIDFRVHDIVGTREFIALESCTSKNLFLSTQNDGYLTKSNTKDKNVNTQFSVIPVPMFTYPQYPSNIHVSSAPAEPVPSAPPAPSFCTLPSTSGQLEPSSSNLYPKFN